MTKPMTKPMTKAGICTSLGSWLCVALLGCNPLVERARKVETAFIGMEDSALRRCLGDAPFFELREDGSELWAYTRPLNTKAADIEITRAFGSGTAHQRPRVEGADTIQRVPILTARDAQESQVPPGNCVYLFVVRDGTIGGYRARGRTMQDMRADESCTLELQRCVPSEPAPPASAG